MKNRLYQIAVCTTVTLWLNNDGFCFRSAGEKKFVGKLCDWSQWQYYWKLYRRDGIERKVYEFLDTFPERFRLSPMFAGIKFE